MSSTVFVNGATLSDAGWFNDTNAVVYNVVGDGSTPPTTPVGAMKNLFKQGANIASATTTNLAAATGNYVHITGTVTIIALGTVNAGVPFWLVFDGALTLTHNGTSLILPGAANITTVAGDIALMISEGSGNWRCINYIKATYIPATGKQPTRQVFTSGSGTYTTPATVTRINVRLIGGGGGGGAVVTNAGTAGNNTTFSTFTAGGGAAGGPSNSAGGAGGTATGGTVNISGGSGNGGQDTSSGTVSLSGGSGGNSAFGGGGSGGQANAAGLNGATNSGGGGGGAGSTSTKSGSGGGSGGYVEGQITSPAATYSYGVGAAANGGAAGTNAGGNGGSGIIIVDEYYT